MSYQPPRPTDWASAELDLLRTHYAARTPRAEILGLLPARTWKAIVGRAHSLGLSRGHQWTEVEIEHLRAYYPREGTKGVREWVPRFSAQQIRQKACLLGILSVRHPGPPPAKPLSPSKQRRADARNANRASRLLTPQVPKPPRVRKTAKVAAPIEPKPDPVRPPSIRTPNLTAQKNAVAAKQKQAAEKPPGYVSAEQIKALAPNHPARIAYTVGASRGGMPAAQKAFHETMNALKQAA